MNKKICIVFVFCLMIGLSIQGTYASNISKTEEESYDLPTSFSWTDIDGVDFTTPVRSQQPYASCETFAFVAALEVMVQWKVGYPFGCDLSEAHLYFWSDGNQDWGSYPENDTDFLVKYGVPDEACWPYPGHLEDPIVFPKNTTCDNWQERTVKITNWSYIRSNDIDAIKNHLVNHGPVPTYLNVYEDFQRYSGGVYRHRWGESVGIHIVPIMGYVDDETIPSGGYWIVKNSWGVELKSGRVWGENGWFRIAYGEAGIEETPFAFGDVYGQFPILYVDDDNTAGPWDGSQAHPYQTITEGIENAYKGWTVFVKNGTYTEQVIINKTVNIDGEAAESTIIDGAGADVVVYVQRPNIRVSGFTIQNSGKQPLNSGIRTLSLNSNATFKNLIIKDCDTGIYLNYAHAPSTNIIHENIIKNNRIGIFSTWSFNIDIKNNTIYNNTEYGIELEAARDSTLINNEIYENGVYGIFLHGRSNKNLIEYNNVTNNKMGIMVKESNDNTIAHNNFESDVYEAKFFRSRGNKWQANYWSDHEKLMLPYIIKGTINLGNLTWFNFDWRPATEPF